MLMIVCKVTSPCFAIASSSSRRLSPSASAPKLWKSCELVPSAQDTKRLLQPSHKKSTSQGIHERLELFAAKVNAQLKSALLELENNDRRPRVSEEVNIIQDLIAQKPEEEEMIAMIMEIIQKDTEALSNERKMLYLTEFFQMLFGTTIPAFQHHDQLLLLQASGAAKDGACESKVADEAGRWKKAPARMNNVEEEKKARERGLDEEKQIESLKGVNHGLLWNPNSMLSVVAEEGNGGVHVSKCYGKQWNPNSMLSVVAEEGNGGVHVSKCYGKQWKVIHQESSLEVVRIVTGEKRMQLSAELGYYYYEVKLVQMVELEYSTGKPGLAGVGVGLAHQAKSHAVAGWYKKSYGYDGRMGHALYNVGKVWVNEIGSLVSGDTLGIGLHTQHDGPPLVFLTKNGVLKGCMSVHGIDRFSCQLYPVISLASLHVEVLVNFCGPFVLPSLSDLVKAEAQNSL